MGCGPFCCYLFSVLDFCVRHQLFDRCFIRQRRHRTRLGASQRTGGESIIESYIERFAGGHRSAESATKSVASCGGVFDLDFVCGFVDGADMPRVL